MDAATVRKRKRIREKLSKLQWVLWIALLGLLGFYMHWRTQQIEVARIVSDEFLTRVGRGEHDVARSNLFTNALKRAIPEELFRKQMELVSRKLGAMQRFQLLEKELSFDNSTCRLIYEVSFDSGPARSILEVVRVKDRGWKLHTFYIWSDAWQKLGNS